MEQLATTLASIDDLCADLTEDQWKCPTGCPGWSVQDNVAHLIDYESTALGRPRPAHQAADLSHTRNEMGAHNEVGVDVRRGRAGADILVELREVTGARLAQLATLTAADLDLPMQTPVGPGTVADLLIIRLMDIWSHEQDIRRAVGRPGHTDGPAVETVVRYLSSFLPYAVGKLAKAPDGTSVVFEIGQLPPVGVEVGDGRARMRDELPLSPAVTLRLDVAQFAALAGGRTDARPNEVMVTGDQVLGRTIAEHLGFMP